MANYPQLLTDRPQKHPFNNCSEKLIATLAYRPAPSPSNQGFEALAKGQDPVVVHKRSPLS